MDVEVFESKGDGVEAYCERPGAAQRQAKYRYGVHSLIERAANGKLSAVTTRSEQAWDPFSLSSCGKMQT